MEISLTRLTAASGDRLPVEIVERKGACHPDTICDSLAEALSVELSRRYVEACGRVLHYNVDKALLWGGSSEPRLGGGRLTAPMEVFLAGRATAQIGEARIDFGEMVHGVTATWLSAHLPLFDARAHLRTHSLIRPGSVDLGELFIRGGSNGPALANDTSVGVGYAPLSRLELLALEAERELGRVSTAGHPEIGRDIKIMAIRDASGVRLIVACAFVDAYLGDLRAYLDAKALVAQTVGDLAASFGVAATVEVNAADNPSTDSIYLTVLGTSAESGDDGEAGRGNRINGLIAPFRPMTMESVAGKNAVSHVGKLYNLAAGLIAERAASLAGVAEAQCLLVGAIGRPVADPKTASVGLRVANSNQVEDYRGQLVQIVEEELACLASASADLISGRLRVGDWPLRRPT